MDVLNGNVYIGLHYIMMIFLCRHMCNMPLKCCDVAQFVVGRQGLKGFSFFSSCCSTGDPLQRLPEDPSVQSGHVTLRGLLPERGPGGRWSLPAPERCDRDQAAQQHVHVPSQPGYEAHLSGLQVICAQTRKKKKCVVFYKC